MQKLLHFLVFAIIILKTSTHIANTNQQNSARRRILSGKRNDKRYIQYFRILNQDSNTINSQEQVSLQNEHETQCITDLDEVNQMMDNYQMNTKYSYNNLIEFENEDQNHQKFFFRALKNNYPYGYSKQQFENEIQTDQRLSTLDDTNIRRYINCYIKTDAEQNELKYFAQYEQLHNNLDIRYDQQKNEYVGLEVSNYLKFPYLARLQHFMQLFETLKDIHHLGITLRNIHTSTIFTNTDLSSISEEILPENFKLYFNNFMYTYDQQNNKAFYFPSRHFIHPETQIFESNEENQKNDIYALCMVYFQVELYGNITQVQNESGETNLVVPNLFSNLDLSNTDVIGKDISPGEKFSKVNQAIKKQRLLISKNLFGNSQYNQRLFEGIQFIVNNNNYSREEKIGDILKVCKDDCRCVLFVGVQEEKKKTPGADFVSQLLEQCLTRNSSMFII